MLTCELDADAIIKELNDFNDFYEELLDSYDEWFDPYADDYYDFDYQSEFYFASSSNICSFGPVHGPGATL